MTYLLLYLFEIGCIDEVLWPHSADGRAVIGDGLSGFYKRVVDHVAKMVDNADSG